MLRSLLAWDTNADIVATLDCLVMRDGVGNVVGVVDFEAHEDSGKPLTDIWKVSNAVASGTWPEWLGEKAHGFKVERQGKRIKALVHKDSGHRRERAAIETAITKRIKDAKGKPADIRDLVGGPDKPLQLDENGRTKPKVKAQPSKLPVIRAK